MRHRRLFHLACGAFLAVAVSTAAGSPAAAAPPAADPVSAATAYLQARAAAPTGGDPMASLSQYLVPGSDLARLERLVALGTAVYNALLGHFVDSVSSTVGVQGAVSASDGTGVTVTAHVITTTVWHTPDRASNTEASGIDHTLTLVRRSGVWRVAADSYYDDLAPAYLEDAGAPPSVVTAAARRLERHSPSPAPGIRIHKIRGREAGRRYHLIIDYGRVAAAAYQDQYALSYNPGYVRFSADCANFASQGARAGCMPVTFGTYNSGWWYDNRGTSSPADDQYSFSWINVAGQFGFWIGRNADWVSSIDNLGKGDLVYYDWSGDGVWDHVAMVVGTNSAGQKVVDAHTTDHYHVYWKLGSSTTKYRYARVRSSFVV